MYPGVILVTVCEQFHNATSEEETPSFHQGWGEQGRGVCVTHSQTKSAAVVMLLAAPEDSHILFVMLLNIHTFSTIPNASLETPFHCSYQHEWTNAHCISGLLVTAARTKLDPSYRLAVRTSWLRSAPISLLFSHMRCRWLRADIVDKKCVN